MKNFFLSVTTGPSAFIFGMKHHLVHFYQACLNNAPVAKNMAPPPGGHMFYVGKT